MARADFTLTAVYEDVEGGWIQARIEELPGVITAAPTREEAEEHLLDALREYLLALPAAAAAAGREAAGKGVGAVERAGLRVAIES